MGITGLGLSNTENAVDLLAAVSQEQQEEERRKRVGHSTESGLLRKQRNEARKRMGQEVGSQMGTLEWGTRLTQAFECKLLIWETQGGSKTGKERQTVKGVITCHLPPQATEAQSS